ncbi:hypothetical protein CRENPOLYSF2_3110004 [Crenothrix polyspora]|uniref:Uncharacterized protein n=1 Tax=Crenothrix polyspora TaxID=360316 RepID=A0A1R4HAD1_9GAMM|nr:hypothetical protein CRENPOLYSF2_3110004 [Crenothrix polyspora]
MWLFTSLDSSLITRPNELGRVFICIAYSVFTRSSSVNQHPKVSSWVNRITVFQPLFYAV